MNKVLEQVHFKVTDGGEWRFLKLIEEDEFGSELQVHTVFIIEKLLTGNQHFQLCSSLCFFGWLRIIIDTKVFGLFIICKTRFYGGLVMMLLVRNWVLKFVIERIW